MQNKPSPISTISTNRFKTISTNNTNKGQSGFNYECDQLYEEFKDLCGDSRYRPYYIKVFYTLGKKRVIELAGIAKADNTNFGYLLKKELGNGHSS